MKPDLHALAAFTAAATAFGMGKELQAAPSPPEKLQTHLRRVLGAVERSGTDCLVLHGLGSGALANSLAKALPPEVSLVVTDLSPQLARALRQQSRADWISPAQGRILLCDTSPWALVILCAQNGLTGKNACHVANPDSACLRTGELREVQRLLTSSPVRTATDAGRADLSSQAESTSTAVPSLSAAAILHPHEPGLDEFFAQFPVWLHELVVVWDAEKPPENPPTCAAGVRHLAHPLDAGFGQQRNRMLDACRGDWVLYLDGDERLDHQLWGELPMLLRQGTQGYYFPRRTFDADRAHCRVGFGLWPDLQLRLFRRNEELRFRNPIHEKLQGLDGPVGVLLNRQLDHESALRKSAEAIREKLARFDEASGRAVSHRLNTEYPTLKCALLDGSLASAPPCWLELAYNPV